MYKSHTLQLIRFSLYSEPKNLISNNKIVESTIFSSKDTEKKYLPIIKAKYVGEIMMIKKSKER